jgi:hypothetical protein
VTSGGPGDARATVAELGRLLLVGFDARLVARAGVRALAAETTALPEDRRVRQEAAASQAAHHWNAQTIVYLIGVIEGHIEALSQMLRPLTIKAHAEKLKQHNEQVRAANRRLREAGASPEKIQFLTSFGRDVFRTLMPALPSLRMGRDLELTARWEEALSRLWLGAPPGRDLPMDMRAVLDEAGEVRNVLLHRLGRVDQRLLDVVAEGPWRNLDELVVIDDGLYRVYAAALFSYADELLMRVRIALGEAAPRDLGDWRENVPVGG